MAYTLNSVDLTTYGIKPGHAPGSNIAMAGIFDMPARIGQTYYEWADDDSIEPYVLEDEMFFGGRDIMFYGFILGTNKQINDYLEALYDAIEALTGLVTFVTPYGSFSVYVKTIVPEFYVGGCKIAITFREPVVNLSEATLPSSGSSAYSIDGIPMTTLGLYYSRGSGLRNLSEMKEQLYTIYGTEGYQITRRKSRNFNMKATIIGLGISGFQSKVKALYKLFSSAGLRTIIINNEIITRCFAVEGFSVSNIILTNEEMIGNFNINLICTDVSLYTADTTNVTADTGIITADAI